MASIQVRKETGCLIMDFYFQGFRCREQTALPDTAANRKKVQKLLDRIETDIAAGTFETALWSMGKSSSSTKGRPAWAARAEASWASVMTPRSRRSRTRCSSSARALVMVSRLSMGMTPRRISISARDATTSPPSDSDSLRYPRRVGATSPAIEG